MKTHVRLILSLVVLVVGVLLITIGVFKPPETVELMMSLNLPHSAYKYLAFVGMGLGSVGVWQFYPVLMNWQRTTVDLAEWAVHSPVQATAVALTCILLGVTIAGSIVWATFKTVSEGQKITIWFKPTALAIVTGGSLIWLGGMILRGAIFGKRK